MERRDTEMNYRAPTSAEVEARLSQAHALRAEMLARGAKWLLRQTSAGLHWLVGLEWGDAERRRKDELSLRYARASSPAHIAPAAPAPAGTGRAKLAVACRRTSRPDQDDEQPRAA